MKALTKSALSLAISSALASNVAFAAEEAQATKNVKDDVEIIEVRGIKSSLAKSLEIKRQAVGVVEAITADDIGKMPDQNIAESLQRLTGVQIDRNAGEGTRVRIRGMDNNLTLLNKETFITGMEYFQLGEGRAEFRDSLEGVPSELLSGVDVFKTPTASLVEGGVGGVVNLRTKSPFSLTESLIAGNVKWDQGSESEEWNPQGVIAVGHNWGDFAAIVTLSTSEKTVHSDQAQNINRENWAWNETSDGQGYILPGMQYESDREYDRERDGATVALGWRPTDDLEFTLDYFYSNLDVDSREYAQKYAMNIDTDGIDESRPYEIDSNGVIKSAYFSQNAGETNASRELTEITAQNVQLGFVYHLNDDFKIDGYLTFSDSELEKEAAFADSRYTPYGVAGYIGPDAGSGNGSGNIVPNEVDGDDGDRSYHFVGGEGLPNITFDDVTALQDPNYQMYKSHWAFADKTDNDAFSAALNAEYYIDKGDLKTVKFGARYFENEVDFHQGRYMSDLSQNGVVFDADNDYGYEAGSAAPDGYNLGDIDGDGISDNQAWGSRYYYLDAAIGNMGFEGQTSGGQSVFEALHGVGGWLWGGSPSTMPIDTFTSDPSRSKLVKDWFPSANGSVNQALFQDTSQMGNPKAWLESINGGAPVDLYTMPLESWNVEVETTAFYGEADFEGDTVPYNLNVGVRVVKTDVTITGAAASQQFNEIWGTHTWNGTYKTWATTSTSDDYWDILPSANFSYELAEDQIVRASFAKVISRPSNQDLGRGFGAEFVRDEDTNQYIFSSGSAGNPNLDPFEAYQYDATYEWYMDELSYLAIGAFYKDVDSFIVSTSVGEAVPDDSDSGSTVANVARPQNGSGGEVLGAEFALQKGFENGLGFIVNYTYSDSETDSKSFTEDDLQLPGVSEHAFNVIGFYEMDGFSARVAYSWRDEYLSPDNTFITIAGLTDTFADGEERPLANYYTDYGQLDASVSYDVTENFTLTAEGINLTEEEQERYAEWENLFRSYSSGEARYVVGVSFRF